MKNEDSVEVKQMIKHQLLAVNQSSETRQGQDLTVPPHSYSPAPHLLAKVLYVSVECNN